MDAARCTTPSRFVASLVRCTSSFTLHPRRQTLTSSTRLFSCLATSSRSLLRAPATSAPPAPTFASTHTFRSWAPPSESPSAGSAHDTASTSSNSSSSSSATASSDKKEDARDTVAAAAAVMAHPYSTRAYRARLQQGHYTSLRELTRAAYAPSPLHVLIDLLRLSVTPQSSLHPTSGLHAALERAVDVQWVLRDTLAGAKDTVLAAETVGDAASHAALQELVVQLETLANATEAAVRGAAPAGEFEEPAEDASLLRLLPSSGNASQKQQQEEDDGESAPLRAWVLPESTHATLLRGLLRLSAVVGAPLHALSALDDLIGLQERLQRAQSRARSCSGTGEQGGQEVDEEEESFSMDDALVLVDAAAQRHVPPLTAEDHLCAMQACATEHHRDFRTTLSLYHRFVQHVTAGRFAATPDDFTHALVALANSSRTTTDFTELRTMMVESEAAAAVPVSVPLYTAIIDAASRAVEEPRRMAIALSLYRRLRDGALTPTADTYAALIACCASTQEPTQAFAFYHEARSVCGVASFTPRVYTNLLRSYSSGGYGADAKKTLEVLVDAGAPLTRASFHAALASAVTVREAEEMLALMTDRYHIAPTPHTFAHVVRAIGAAPAGVRTALQLFDTHEEALRALARLSSADGEAAATTASSDGVAVSSSGVGVGLEPLLLERYPAYVRALEGALMRLRVDPSQDPRVKAYLTPLIRVAQQRMNAFTGMAPQSPLHVPEKERLCIAVLAADVLANVDAYVMPFMAHYSVLVVPYSALVALQKGGGRRVDGAMVKGAAAGLHDAVWQETAGGAEQDAVVEHRRRRLQRFLADHRDVVHLVSLEEELRWSRETRRYGVGVTDLLARAAATALHLAHLPEVERASLVAVDDSGTAHTVYARHPSASIVLVSADYERCGKHVVALKRAGGRDGSAGLRAALRRVSYHNPRTNPNWVPPTLSVTHQQQEKEREKGEVEEKEGETAEVASAHDAAQRSSLGGSAVEHARLSVVGGEAAAALYRQLLSSDASTHEEEDVPRVEETAVAGAERHRNVDGEASAVAAGVEKEEDEDLSADDLMALLNS